ncbi:MAG: O-antigen ligase family protein [Candidatus Aminicenantales bacterium]
MWKIRIDKNRPAVKPYVSAPEVPDPSSRKSGSGADGYETLSPKDRICRKILDYGILALLVWTPLPIASVEAWSILVMEIGVFALYAVYLFMDRKPRPGIKLMEEIRHLRPVFFGLFLFLGFQMLPLPAMIIRVFSPRTAALRAQFVPVSAQAKMTTFSLHPGATLGAMLELAACVLIGSLILRTVTHRIQIRRIMLTLIGVGVFEALYGMFELYRNNPRLLFYRKTFNLDSATGTFVNRNHFAGYLEMVIPLALGLIVSRFDLFGEPGTPWRARLARFLNRGLAVNILLGAGLVVMAVGLLLSNSRSGVVVLALTFVLMSVLAAQAFGHTRMQKGWVRHIIQIAVLAIIGLGLYVGLEAMIGRFALDKLLQDGRPRYWGAVMTMIGQFPLFGVGFGAFGSVYPAYDTTGMEYALVHAHNDYLELLSELGIVGAGLLAFALGFILFKSFRTWMARRHPELKGLALGCLASSAAILIHSMTDFNLQIPANAFVFSVVLALTMKTVYHRKT